MPTSFNIRNSPQLVKVVPTTFGLLIGLEMFVTPTSEIFECICLHTHSLKPVHISESYQYPSECMGWPSSLAVVHLWLWIITIMITNIMITNIIMNMSKHTLWYLSKSSEVLSETILSHAERLWAQSQPTSGHTSGHPSAWCLTCCLYDLTWTSYGWCCKCNFLVNWKSKLMLEALRFGKHKLIVFECFLMLLNRS